MGVPICTRLGGNAKETQSHPLFTKTSIFSKNIFEKEMQDIKLYQSLEKIPSGKFGFVHSEACFRFGYGMFFISKLLSIVQYHKSNKSDEVFEEIQ